MYSFCHSQLAERMTGFIDFYNSELDRCYTLLDKKRADSSITPMDSKQESQFLLDSRCMLPDKINWSAGLTSLFLRKTPIEQTTEIRTVMMRPFCKEYLFFNRKVIERPSKWSAILPDEGHPNLIICVSGAPLKKDFSVLITDCIQDFHTLENSQSFPLYLYDEEHAMDGQLSIADLMENVEEQKTTYKRRYAISDASLAKFNSLYGNKVTKEDIFYYVYAVLHSKKYIEEYADNLSKELPRIPTLDRFAEWVRIGRELANLHLHYEKPADPAALGLTIQMTKEDYTVEKMRFPKEGKVAKKDTIQYNNWITISNIPERAYEYIINGQSAIEWIMEKYQVTTDKASGIKSNPNDYAGGKYIFDLLISIISMSLKTLDLIDALPEYKEI